jgi:hypothetical protein
MVSPAGRMDWKRNRIASDVWAYSFFAVKHPLADHVTSFPYRSGLCCTSRRLQQRRALHVVRSWQRQHVENLGRDGCQWNPILADGMPLVSMPIPQDATGVVHPTLQHISGIEEIKVGDASVRSLDAQDCIFPEFPEDAATRKHGVALAARADGRHVTHPQSAELTLHGQTAQASVPAQAFALIICSACLSDVSVTLAPLSMRATSSVRSSPVMLRTEVFVRPPDSFFSIR